MNLEMLRQIAASGETDTTEFKRTTGELTAGIRTVCALLNKGGGFVLFGVHDSGRLSGQPVSTKTREEIAQQLHKIEPPVFPDLEEVPLDLGNSVLVPSGCFWRSCMVHIAGRIDQPKASPLTISMLPKLFARWKKRFGADGWRTQVHET